MTTLLRAAALACLTLSAVPQAARAQNAPAKLATGAWTGTVSPPGEPTLSITYDVSYAGDTLQIRINAGEHGQFTVRELSHTATRISFSFTPGPDVVCALDLNDEGVYAGDCTDDGGTPVAMTMTPPAAKASKTSGT